MVGTVTKIDPLLKMVIELSMFGDMYRGEKQSR